MSLCTPLTQRSGAPLFLILALDVGEWQIHAMDALPQYPLNRRLGGPLSKSEHYEREKNPLP